MEELAPSTVKLETVEPAKTNLERPPPEPTSWKRWAWPLVKHLLRDGRPILVGPWHSEVGFEILYWLPFLARLKHDFGLPADRFIPITRGGAALWYGTPTGLELYAMRSPQAIRVHTRQQVDQRHTQKQYWQGGFDQQIIKDAAETMGLKHYHVLHPSWMYYALAPFWKGEKGLQWLLDRVRFEGMPVAPLPSAMQLPEKFLAARFYFRSTFPPTEDAVQFAKATLQQVAHDLPVVILDSGTLSLDDHLDFAPRDIPNVYCLSDLVPMLAETNLLTQSAVLARSVGFVGTYGGFAQLALRYRKPVVSLYRAWEGTALAHHTLTQFLALSQDVAFHTIKIGEIPLLQSVLPEVKLRLDAPKDKTPSEWQATPALVEA